MIEPTEWLPELARQLSGEAGTDLFQRREDKALVEVGSDLSASLGVRAAVRWLNPVRFQDFLGTARTSLLSRGFDEAG